MATDIGDCGGGEFDKDGYMSSGAMLSPGRTSSRASSTAAALDMVLVKKAADRGDDACGGSSGSLFICVKSAVWGDINGSRDVWVNDGLGPS